MQQPSYNTLNSGINSFVAASPDYELAPLGLASLTEQADRLAEYGRNGDIYVVHAAEGETVIPMEVLEANPKIKELLFNQMRDMGINPAEYVVGNELNSINPDTGMPEFFIKGIFKAVKKVFKAVAPIVVPLVGNAILPGIGGILASGIYTKLSGGSWGDVLKGAALSYAGGAITQGIMGSGSFFDDLGAGLRAPYDAAMNIRQSAGQGIFGSAGKANLPGASLKDQVFRTFDPNAAQPAPQVLAPQTLPPAANPDTFSPGASGVDTGGGYFPPTDPSASNLGVGQAKVAPPPVKERGFFGRKLGLDSVDDFTSDAGDYLFRGGESSKDLADAADKLGAEYQRITPKQFQTSQGFEAFKAKAQPNLLEKYGPSLALAGGAAYFGGAFDPAEDPYAEQREKDRLALEAAQGPNRLLASNPDRYMVRDLDPTKYAPTANFAAEGGLMQLKNGGSAQYPRREMLVEGPGTERSDDIPAMLSDGEFVLNAKSVRGADPTGQGNRYRGAQNLYGMMRDFEMRG